MKVSHRTKVLATATASVLVLGLLVPLITGSSVFSLVGGQSNVGNCSPVGGQSSLGGQSGQSNVGGQSTVGCCSNVGGQSTVGCCSTIGGCSTVGGCRTVGGQSTASCLPVPGVPTDVSVSALSGMAFLRWEPPTDSGPLVTGFQIDVQPMTGQQFSVTVGAVLTAAISGLINGMSYSFTVAAINAGGTGGFSGPVDIVVGVPPAMTSSSSATFTKGVYGTFTPTATGLPNPKILKTGALPTGVTYFGRLSGTPTVTGTFHITFTAHNGVGGDATQDFVLRVLGFHVSTTALPTLTRGLAYSDKLAALGGKAPLTWKTTTVLPAGLKLSIYGLLSGTVPNTVPAGTRSIKVTVTDASLPTHQVASATLTLKIS